MCQPEDTIAGYLDLTKTLYKVKGAFRAVADVRECRQPWWGER